LRVRRRSTACCGIIAILMPRPRRTRASAHPNLSNALLQSLNDQGRKRLARASERVWLTPKQVLYRPEEHISEIYFPENCVIVMMSVMKNGATIESATVGNEGASWISASFRSPTMPCQTMVAIPGLAHRVPARFVEREIKRNGDFHNTLSHYSHSLLIQTLRSTACNGLHSLEQRCSRWILTTLDRTSLEQFVITHEFLSELLGVRRSSVSLFVERLAAKGILTIRRGSIRVLDRKALERTACECYRIMRDAAQPTPEFR
jgi:Crp-like helix-turn-helix protein